MYIIFISPTKVQGSGPRRCLAPYALQREKRYDLATVEGARRLHHLLQRNVQRFRSVLVFKAHRLCASFNSRLESKNKFGLPSSALGTDQKPKTGIWPRVEVKVLQPQYEVRYLIWTLYLNEKRIRKTK